MRILMLRGLPASGKSSFARELIESAPNLRWVRVNKDELRAMMHNSRHTKANENQVLRVRDAIIRDTLKEGRSVIVDDTNFAPHHEITLRNIANEFHCEFEIKFFDTPMNDCIRRDLQRVNSVGEKVIRDMWLQYLAPTPVDYQPDPNLRAAIICDIDGTLAHMSTRLRFGRQAPYKWDAVGEDDIDSVIRDLLNVYREKGWTIILLSGRDSICRPETEEWLTLNGVQYDLLLMREQDDNRKDDIIKRELFEKHIRNDYYVSFVLDDRAQVVRMWRDELGLKVFQVADGNF